MNWERRCSLEHTHLKCICRSQLLCLSEGGFQQFGGGGGIHAGDAFRDGSCVCAIRCHEDFPSGFYGPKCGFLGNKTVTMRVE